MSRKKQKTSKLTKFKEKLRQGYYQSRNPTAFGGARSLRKKYAKTPKERQITTEWLRAQDTYTLHKPAKTKFVRRPTIVAGMGEQLQADLLDVSKYAEENQGVTFLLTSIDVFSKKAWVRPLTSKRGPGVAEALREILHLSKCRTIQTDKGKEFLNRHVAEMLTDMKVDMFHTENESTKATIVERFNQTLKQKMYRLITYQQGKTEYISNLQKLVAGYNNTVHTSINNKPNDVSYQNQHKLWQEIDVRHQTISSRKNSKRTPILPGMHVRISKARTAFERGYTPNWTSEIFTVRATVPFTKPTTYSIEDLGGEPVEGQFYRQELQIVSKPTVFRVENIIKTKNTNGLKMLFVKWFGYPTSFNSWISENNIV